MRKLLLLVAGIGSLPLTGSAQTAPVAPRFYVGLGASLLTDKPFHSYSRPSLFGPAVTAGVQLNPRLALQTGAALGWRHETFTSTPYTDPTQPANQPINTSEYRTRVLAVPLLARFTRTPPAKRLRVDALGGVTLLHSTAHGTISLIYPTQTYHTEVSLSTTNFNASLGPAVRYALTSQVELTADALVNAALGSGYFQFSDRLYLNVLVGARYTFGQR